MELTKNEAELKSVVEIGFFTIIGIAENNFAFSSVTKLFVNISLNPFEER